MKREMTVVIIETCYKNFDEYLHLLSKPAKKNYAYTRKHNQDLIYEMVPYDKEEVEKFMNLWEQQLVYGKPIQWCFPYKFIENLAINGKLLCFRARKGDETIAVHFIQKRIGFWESHPPMYEKTEENEKRYLAKYMWFSLIKYFIQHQLEPLDMGGGVDSWRDTIRRRQEFPNLNYKWTYVPDRAKENPENERPYIIKMRGPEKMLDYDNHALFRDKKISFIFEALRMRLRYRFFGADFLERKNLDKYLGDSILWSDDRARSLFASEGIYEDGWTDKKIHIDFLNSNFEYIRILTEFPVWSGKSYTTVRGKINGNYFIKKQVRAGQYELVVGPLQKNQRNRVTLSLGKQFNMPAPDVRSCYLRVIEVNPA